MRANPKRKIKFRAVSLELNDSGLGFYTVEMLFSDLGIQPSPFKGKWVQITRAELWGGYGISSGTAKRMVATLTDMQTGISVTDRGALDQCPRVGLDWPPAARRVYNSIDTEQVLSVTSSDGSGGKAEFYLLLTVVGW